MPMAESSVSRYKVLIVWFQKFQTKIIPFVCVVAFVQSAFALERLGSIGQTYSFPAFGDSEITQHFEGIYFLHEQVAAQVSLSTQLEGKNLFVLELGPELYLLRDKRVLPFISGKLLYTLFPNGEAGWATYVGVEIQPSKSTEIENLRIRFLSGAGQIFFSDETFLIVDVARFGLFWTF